MKNTVKGFVIACIMACVMVVATPKPALACVDMNPADASTYATMLWIAYGEWFWWSAGVQSVDELTLMLLGDICV